jgi:hypothetical protein
MNFFFRNLAMNTRLTNILFRLCLFVFSVVQPLQSTEWNLLTPPNSPDARQSHSMVTLPDGRVMLFAGENAGGELLNDLHVFEVNSNDWAKVTPSNNPPLENAFPTGVTGHSMTSAGETVVFIFGGETGEGLSDRIYEFNIETGEVVQRQPEGESPPPRKHHGAFYVNGHLYVIGGESSGQALYRTWSYSDEENRWEEKAPAPDYIAAFSSGIAVTPKGNAYVFDFTHNKIGKYDIASDTWGLIVPTGNVPSPRKYAAMVYNESYAYIFGGEGSVLNDTWVFDFESEKYTRKSDMPFALEKSAAAFNKYGDEIILFGGILSDSTCSGATLIYTPNGTGISTNKHIPAGFTLAQNYPNPFNPGTVIRYTVKQPSRVILKVFDVMGHEIQILEDSYRTAGEYQVQFESEDLPSGIYLYRIQINGFQAVKKMLKIE